MSAGTINVINGGSTVWGSGTAFTSEFKPGDFIVTVVGQITYTLIVSEIISDGQVTLTKQYTGPSFDNLAWYAIPRAIQNQVTAELVAQTTEALRGLNYDKQNWQQLFTGTGNVTIKLPDGGSFTGPAWNTITTYVDNGLSGKADKASLGNSSELNVGTGAGTVAAGNDSRLNTIDGKTGGTVTGAVKANGFMAANGSGFSVLPYEQNQIDIGNAANGVVAGGAVGWMIYRWYNEAAQTGIFRAADDTIKGFFIYLTSTGAWEFQRSGNATAPGSWISGSDIRHKNNITEVNDSLASVLSWRGVTYDKKDGVSEVGLIAQDVEKSCPVAISSNGERKFTDGTVIPDFKYLNVAGVSAAYHTEAIKSLLSLIELSLTEPEAAKKAIREIKAMSVKIKESTIDDSERE